MTEPKSLREAVERLRQEMRAKELDKRTRYANEDYSGDYGYACALQDFGERLDAILAAHPDAPEPVTPPFAGLPDHMHGFAGLPDHWQPTTALPPPASRREVARLTEDRVTLPDDVSVKMLQNEVAVLERRRDELLAALKALESCVVWSDTIQGYVLYQRVRDVLGPAREAIAKAEGK